MAWSEEEWKVQFFRHWHISNKFYNGIDSEEQYIFYESKFQNITIKKEIRFQYNECYDARKN
jgi:hypothetical protein